MTKIEKTKKEVNKLDFLDLPNFKWVSTLFCLTPKRLEKMRLIIDDDYNWIDTKTGAVIDPEDAFDIVNKQHELIELLKIKINGLENDIFEIQKDCIACEENYEQQLKDCTKLAKEEIRKEKEDAAIRWANIGR